MRSTCSYRFQIPGFGKRNCTSKSNLLLEAPTVHPQFAHSLWKYPYDSYVVLFIIRSWFCAVSFLLFSLFYNVNWPHRERSLSVPMVRHYSSRTCSQLMCQLRFLLPYQGNLPGDPQSDLRKFVLNFTWGDAHGNTTFVLHTHFVPACIRIRSSVPSVLPKLPRFPWRYAA